MKSEADPGGCVIFWTGVPAEAEQKYLVLNKNPVLYKNVMVAILFRLNTIPSWEREKILTWFIKNRFVLCSIVIDECTVFIGDLKVIDVKL